jgi:hypothetical protein
VQQSLKLLVPFCILSYARGWCSLHRPIGSTGEDVWHLCTKISLFLQLSFSREVAIACPIVRIIIWKGKYRPCRPCASPKNKAKTISDRNEFQLLDEIGGRYVRIDCYPDSMGFGFCKVRRLVSSSSNYHLPRPYGHALLTKSACDNI